MEERKKSLIYILDLEMNQPSGSIIQIGSVLLDMGTGEIERRVLTVTNPGEFPSNEITNLTGITRKDVAKGVPIYEALKALWKDVPQKASLGCWGNDWEVIARNVGHYALDATGKVQKPENILKRQLDMSACFKAIMELKGAGSRLQSLRKIAEERGLVWEGSEHNAQDDAYMAAKVWWSLVGA